MKSKGVSILLVACLVLSLLLGMKPHKAQAALGSSDFLKTSGIFLKNNRGNGSTVTLRGTSLGNWLMEEAWMGPGGTDEYTTRTTLINRFGSDTTDSIKAVYQDTWIQANDLDNIKNLGLNLVRVPIYWENLMNRDGTMKPDSVAFRKLDWVVSQAGQRGIYVLLDLHGVPGNASNGWQSGGWTGHNDFWSNTTYQNWVVQIWQRLATHYVGNPAVFGYDLLNEPVSNNPNLTISQEYNTLYQTVRAIDPDHIVVVEAFGSWGNLVPPSTYGWTNVVYQLHYYDWNSSSWSSQNSSIDGWFSGISSNQPSYNVPVFAGEFSLWSYNDLWGKWLSGLDALNTSWANWAYKTKDPNNWGLYNNCYAAVPDYNNDSVATIESKLSQWGTSSCFQANTALQNIFTAYANVNVGATSSLTALATNQYVSADNYGNNPLIANRTAVGTWEKFTIVNNPDGTVSFLSKINGKYVTADLNNGAKLIAEAQGILGWEKFWRINNADGTVSFQALANNNYVCTDLNTGSPTLIANRASASTWEKYVINPAP